MDNSLLMLLPFLMNNKSNGSNGSFPMELMMKMMGNGGGGSGNINPLMLMMMSMMGGMGANNKKCGPNNNKKQEKSDVDISGVFGGDVASILKMYMEYCNPQKNRGDK